MTLHLTKLPAIAALMSLMIGGCSVSTSAPGGPGAIGQPREAERYDRRDDERRAERRDDRHDGRGDKRRDRDEDRDDDRRGRRDDRSDDRRDRRDDPRSGANVQINIGGYFGERERGAMYEYYGKPKKAHCPPGLAKKGNDCQAPGQAKKWKLGQPLSRDSGYRPVEADVRIRLGTPPAGHDFVRVASDILLIAVGTSMVIDAIEDLGGR